MRAFMATAVAATLGFSSGGALADGVWTKVDGRDNCVTWIKWELEMVSVAWTGKCANGKTNGEGLLTYQYLHNGKQYTTRYEGHLTMGKASGNGVLVQSWGWKFQGEFVNGKISGYGVEQTDDGGRYEGEWKDNNWHGWGKYDYPSGGKYVGEWRETKRHGQGIYTDVNGQKKAGQWKDDKYVGQ